MRKTVRRSGAPSKYEDASPLILQNISKGMSFAKASETAGVSYHSFNHWRKEYPEFDRAVKSALAQWRKERTGQVELSIYDKAMGYDYEESKTEYEASGDGTMIPVRKVVTKKHCPPDTAAAIFLLCNLQPEKWKSRDSGALYTASGGKVTSDWRDLDCAGGNYVPPSTISDDEYTPPTTILAETGQYMESVCRTIGDGVILRSHWAGLDMLAESLDTFKRSSIIIDKEGMIVYTSGGKAVKHPLEKVRTEAQIQALKIMTDFGLTPKSRERIKALQSENDDDSPLMGFLNKGRDE